MNFIISCLLLILVSTSGETDVKADYYTAAVVEYAPQSNPDMDAEENMLNNAANYVNFMKNASSLQVDIIVFPEIGLKGYGNQEYTAMVPGVDEGIIPCTSETKQSKVMEVLSCGASKYKMYVVVNLPEVSHNSTTNVTHYYNTNVVFDRNGMVVARYRKYHLFGEPDKTVPELEHIYFDTDFGVRFGVFICFDIIFKEPPVTLAREYGVKHFVFPTAWFSEMPFLTAIQAQWSFAYGLDVVLLASGYNDPKVGSAGSGIYVGRSGSQLYSMKESHHSGMLIGRVSKDGSSGKTLSETVIGKFEEKESNIEPIKMKQDDALQVFKTQLLFPPEVCDSKPCINDNTSVATLTYNTVTELCDNSFCCLFNITMSTTYERSKPAQTRGDDYNSLYYRLAAFNGVRTYSTFATGGLQVCSILSCVNDTLDSCGLRADDITAQPRQIIDSHQTVFYQTKTTFNHIEIHADFDDTDAAISPDIMVSGSDNNFGALVPSNNIIYFKTEPFNGTSHSELIVTELQNIVTFAIYGRQFSRDGDDATTSGSKSASCYASLFIVFSLILLRFNY